MKNLSSCKFANPIKKIEIPEMYRLIEHKVQANTQAVGFVTVNYLKKAEELLDSKEALRYLIPITAENMARPYEIKVELLYMLIREAKKVGKLNVCSGF